MQMKARTIPKPMPTARGFTGGLLMAVVVVVAGEGNFVRGSLEQWFLTGGGANLPREGVNKFPGGGVNP